MFGIKGSFARASKIEFFKNLESYEAQGLYKKACMVAPSTGPSEKYEWLGGLPGMHEWLDERQIEALEKFDYTIVNKKWASTLGFDVDELNDNPAVVKARIPLLAKSAAEHKDELFFDRLVAGATDLCYDGKAFFATDHPTMFEGGTAFSNKVSGAGVAEANIITDFNASRILLLGYKKRNGRPLFRTPGKLVAFCAPANIGVFEDVFLAKNTTYNKPNKYFGMADVVPIGDLSGNDWYLGKVDHPVKPFVLQMRQNIKTEWDTTERFKRGKIFFGADARYNIGYALPQLCIMIDN